MNKIVYNACYGGFDLSEEAMLLYGEYIGVKLYVEKDPITTYYWTHPEANSNEWDKYKEYYFTLDFERHDPLLVRVVEELGSEKASGEHAKLRIYETDSDHYRINEYDGNESVEVPESQEWVTIQ